MIGSDDVILAIDPGPKQSAFCFYCHIHKKYKITAGIVDNDDLLEVVRRTAADTVAIEMIASYGMPVGAEVFETCVWIGRFRQASKRPVDYVYRKEVKMHLCGSMRANDSTIRQALIDKFGPGRDIAIGKKANKGPLYEIKRDMWAALAVAVTYDERIK